MTDTELPAAGAVEQQARDLGLRTHLAVPRDGTLGARIRDYRLAPYQLIIGPKEAAAGHVALRPRDGRRLDPRPAAEVLDRISALVADHSIDLWEA